MAGGSLAPQQDAAAPCPPVLFRARGSGAVVLGSGEEPFLFRFQIHKSRIGI